MIDAALEEGTGSRLLALHDPVSFLVLHLCAETGVISPWVACISWGEGSSWVGVYKCVWGGNK